MKRLTIAVMLAVLLLNSALAQQRLVIAGTGDSQTLLRLLAEVFEKTHPEAIVEIPDSVGSSGGIRALINGNADLARTARALKDDEKPGLTPILFAQSPLVFAVHPSVTGVSDLSTEQILKIYSGQYRNWRELGGPDHKIYPVGREHGDSSYQLLAKTLPGFKDIEYAAKIFYTTPETAAALVKHQFAIGFLSLSTINKSNLKPLSVNGVAPVDKHYPHVIPYYIVVKGEPSGLVKQFIDFLFLEDTQILMQEAGVVPVGMNK